MRIRKIGSMTAFVLLVGWGSSAYAGCSNNQLAGSWDVVFSDGNSCRLVLDDEGDVLIAEDRSESTCFDPFRGVTTPDSGTYTVDQKCEFSFALVVEGLNVSLFGRLTPNQQIGSGFYVITSGQFPVDKGSFTMGPVKK